MKAGYFAGPLGWFYTFARQKNAVQHFIIYKAREKKIITLGLWQKKGTEGRLSFLLAKSACGEKSSSAAGHRLLDRRTSAKASWQSAERREQSCFWAPRGAPLRPRGLSADWARPARPQPHQTNTRRGPAHERTLNSHGRPRWGHWVAGGPALALGLPAGARVCNCLPQNIPNLSRKPWDSGSCLATTVNTRFWWGWSWVP